MDIRKWLYRAYRAYRKQKTWQQAVRAMAMVVVFCTTYALILPAITVETDTICGMTPHSHSEECYETVVIMDCILPESEGHTHSEECYEEVKTQTCQLPEVEAHKHTEQCYVQETVCGQETQPAHVHSEDCKGTVETRICADTSEEHEHVGTCYVYEEGLICGQEETEGHTHAEDCWESRQNCGQEETEGHAHTDSCFAVSKNLACGMEESEAHSHTTTVLICGLEEHVHDETCYPETEPETTIAASLPEGDPQADLETAEDWETSFATLELTGDWSEDLIAVAKTQLGYTESSKNYIYDENNQAKGYTRYGQWGSDPYADWSAMFASFCLHYAGVDGIAPEQDCQLWLEKLNEAEIYREAAQYIPVPGDLIFLDRDADEICDHVAIVEAVDAATEEKAGAVHLIAGDWENRVDRCELSLDAEIILGYAILPTEPEEEPADPTETTRATEPTDPTQSTEETEPTDPTESTEATEATEPPVRTHSGEDGTQIQVRLPEDTAVPADADLTVTEVTETDEQYAAMAEQVRSLVEEDIVSMSLLDISFYDSEGAYIHVPDTASVTITLKDAEVVPGERKVFHFVDGVPVELEKVSVNSVATAAEDGTESMQTYLTFETEGFSVFAVVEVVSSEEKYESVSGVAATAMAGEYYILNYDSTAAMMAEVTVNNKNGYSAISETTVADAQELSSYSLWTLELVNENNYRVYSTDDQGNRQYLVAQNVVSAGVERPDWGVGALTLTDDEAEATVFALTVNDGVYSFSFDNGSKMRYITDLNDSTMTNADTPYGFTMHTEKGTESQLRLYREIPETVVPVTGLGGHKYAIVNLNSASRQFAMTSEHVNDSTKLKAVEVVVINAQDGNTYVAGEGITEWEFIEADDGYYNIRATDTGKYLNLIGNGSENITTSDTEQPILVEINTTYGAGQVTLKANNAKINWIGANAYRGDIFGVWSGTDQNSCQNLCTVQPIGLLYDLNKPAGATWVNEPKIGNEFQKVTAEGVQVQSVNGKNAVGTFVDDTIYDSAQPNVRTNVRNYYNNYNSSLSNDGKLTEDSHRAPGAEFKFLGWKATVDDAEYWFDEGTTATMDSKGNIHIIDTSGVERILPFGTTLVGQWKKLSDVVMFFVNYGDTMLETQDNHPIIGYGAGYYTGVVAIAHIYDADGAIDTISPSKVNVTNSDGSVSEKDAILRSNDALIQAEIVAAFDPSKAGTQVVIDAVAKHNDTSNNFEFVTVNNFNQNQLEAIVGEYLRKDTNSKTQVKLDNAYIDKSEINTDNYKLYWYLQKEVANDGWHIDGVLVAKTQSMEIYKTFSGLTRAEAETAIDQMTFPLHLIHSTSVTAEGSTEAVEYDVKDHYKTLTATGNETGVYHADGWQSNGNIYKWTLESVQGQRYTFEESGYNELKDESGNTIYDVSSLVSVHYSDTNKTVLYKYNTDKTYTDTSETTGVTDSITDLFASKPLVGGEVESVIFANFYTPTGTGMFSISKVADAEGKIRLSGAKFALYTQTTSDGTVTEVLYDLNGDGTANESDYVTTNENGAAHFSNLPAGTYILKEESPPSGYRSVTTTWTVEVSVDNKSTEDTTDDSVIVTIKETGSTTNAVTIYDRLNGGIQDNGVYLIQNTPIEDTVTVNKYFKNISSDEIAWLKSYYSIEVTDVKGEDAPITLTLNNGSPITGTMNGFTWTIDLPCGTEYIFSEIYFSHRNYLDTIVTATVNGEQMAVSKGTGTVMVYENGSTTPVATVVPTAYFTMTKTQAADTVNITNDYSNTFDLQIHKVDATNGNANMEGVEFNIYGDFEFHKKPTNGAADTIAYRADDGTSKTAWYIGTTAATDANGLTLFADMKLSSGSNTFLYVIDEANTPAGYVKLDEPIVKVVEVSGDGYFNGVYTLQVENYKEAQATVTVTATKTWDIPAEMTLDANQEVELTLYKMVRQKAAGSDQITDTVTAVETVKLNAANGWTKTWTGLPYAQGNVRNEYFIAETPIDGFNTSYSTTVSNLTVGSSKVDAAKADGYELKRSVVVTNSTGFELPSTGGVGEPVFVFLGLMLILAGGLYWLEAKKKTVRGRE